MFTPSARRLLPIVLAYLPVPILGAALSIAWGVGASPEGGPADLPFRGTALAPPLFLPVVLLGAAALARRPGVGGRIGAGVVSLVATAFLAGSTFNLPNDFAAAESAGSPIALSAGLAVVHIVLSLALLASAVPTLVDRGRDRSMQPA